MPGSTSLDWRRRFTAAQVGLPRWSPSLPDRLAYVSTASGSWQVWIEERDRPTRLTDAEVGVEDVIVAPNGGIVWWEDGTGDERGRWVLHDPRTGTTGPLVPDAPEGWSTGITIASETVAYGVATGSGYRVSIRREDGTSAQLAASDEPLGVGSIERHGSGGLSADGTIVAIRHTEGGDILHRSIRAVAADGGTTIGELTDPGGNVDPAAWSPIEGDQRLLVTSELRPFERPAIWNPVTGERRELEVDLPGAILPLGWWPDASAVLARQEHAGRDRLLRIDPETSVASVVADTGGEIPEAAVRPDGTVWLLTSDGVRPRRVETAAGEPILVPPGEPAPAGRPLRPLWFDNAHGDPIQAFAVTPPGSGPFPTVVSVHGGPEWHERNRYDPETQTLVDAGYAVVLPNYRGSTGYGVAFRRSLIGDPWLPESEDVLACVDAAVAAGITDPERVAFAGWSWGGCLACLNAGLHPERWKAVFAGIPAGDAVAAHRASMPEIQAFDVAIYGGSPEELPERWAERDPMTFVDRVRAPVLIVAGEHDPRCPLEGVTPWVEAVTERGVPVELRTYPAGHHANATDQQIEHMAAILDFFGRTL